ncbi:hypothetical protein [Clostridium sp. ZBS17]|uniref:hypothetical protein n=1 Tax=Clostridium sp. ZBS17 TaxID=2949968 RepID=UPI00207A57C4|nr:hypothetical protein [Clostridium sp. ZBS17]
MKKIGLIDADLMDNGTRHPNLALMKIAGYYKDLGNEVELIYKSYNDVYDYDELFISRVFTFTEVPDWVLKLPNIRYGGTGFYEDGGENLPNEIEHHMPYYDLYLEYVNEQIAKGKQRSKFADYLDYSIGFTTRGCFRKCSFCVNKKYSNSFLHSHVNEFLDEERPYIYLWDDNILSHPKWAEVLDNLEATGKPFQFRQGLDLRLMTDEKANRFVNAHYQGDFIFAFDHIEDRELIVEKVQLWKRYSSKICKMYVISAYNSQDEKDIEDVFERIYTLMQYGSLPYIMRFEEYKNSPYKDIYIQLARWCNQPGFFKKKSFREFCVANQEYKKDQSTNCSAYQSMLDFEEKFPEIAQKYFDLRFDRENIYAVQYGYGRRYANKPLCSYCENKGLSWNKIVNDNKLLVQKYLCKEIDIECLKYKNSECKCNSQEIAEKITNALLGFSLDELIDILKSSENHEEITRENIPQFSKIEDAIFSVPQLLVNGNLKISFEEMGYYLSRENAEAKKNEVALKKYGENHAKMAALIDLARVSKADSRALIESSEMAKYYMTLSKDIKTKLLARLCLRIPIVQNQCISGESSDMLDKDMLILSKETQKRRRSNVVSVVKYIKDNV